MRRLSNPRLALAASAVFGLVAAIGCRALADEKPAAPAGTPGKPTPQASAAAGEKKLVFTLERYRREPWLAAEGAAVKDEVYEKKEITREQAVQLVGTWLTGEPKAALDDAELVRRIEQYNRMGGEAAMRRVIRAERSRIVVTEVAVETPRVDP